MNAESRLLVKKLSAALKTTPQKIITQAINRMAIAYGLAGVAVDWNKEAIRRGYRK